VREGKILSVEGEGVIEVALGARKICTRAWVFDVFTFDGGIAPGWSSFSFEPAFDSKFLDRYGCWFGFVGFVFAVFVEI